MDDIHLPQKNFISLILLRYLQITDIQSTCRCQIAFTINKAAFDHEGWAVGVAALWGYFINFDDYNGIIFMAYNLVIAKHSLRQAEPFRGIATAPWRARLEKVSVSMFVFPSAYRNNIVRKCNKVFAYVPSSVTT